MTEKYQKLFLIQTSACISETITFPIDYIKTKIQVDKNRIGFFNQFKKTIHNQNLSIIYNGLKPALLRHCVYTMLRISIYEELNKLTDNSLASKMLIGGFSGAIAQFIASPFDLLKVQYITNNNPNKTLYRSIQSIVNTNGVLGLWKGVTPNVSRALLVNLGELATYDYSKQIIKKYTQCDDSTPLHVVSSILSGFSASVCCTPADVIKSRMMQTDSKYRGVFDCLHKTVKQEGPSALYKGFFPIWFRLAPWQLVFWVSYEKLRYLSGLEGF